MNITDEDRELAMFLSQFGAPKSEMAKRIAAYRHRLTSQSADTIQQQKDALRVAAKECKEIASLSHTFRSSQVHTINEQRALKVIALIQPLLKD